MTTLTFQELVEAIVGTSGDSSCIPSVSPENPSLQQPSLTTSCWSAATPQSLLPSLQTLQLPPLSLDDWKQLSQHELISVSRFCTFLRSYAIVSFGPVQVMSLNAIERESLYWEYDWGVYFGHIHIQLPPVSSTTAQKARLSSQANKLSRCFFLSTLESHESAFAETMEFLTGLMNFVSSNFPSSTNVPSPQSPQASTPTPCATGSPKTFNLWFHGGHYRSGQLVQQLLTEVIYPWYQLQPDRITTNCGLHIDGTTFSVNASLGLQHIQNLSLHNCTIDDGGIQLSDQIYETGSRWTNLALYETEMNAEAIGTAIEDSAHLTSLVVHPWYNNPALLEGIIQNTSLQCIKMVGAMDEYSALRDLEHLLANSNAHSIAYHISLIQRCSGSSRRSFFRNIKGALRSNASIHQLSFRYFFGQETVEDEAIRCILRENRISSHLQRSLMLIHQERRASLLGATLSNRTVRGSPRLLFDILSNSADLIIENHPATGQK